MEEVGVRQRITEAFQIDYSGFEAVKPCCANCQHVKEEYFAGMDYFYCTNLDTKHYIEGGMVDKPILDADGWSCPLWELKG